MYDTPQGDAAQVPDVDDASELDATTDALRTLGIDDVTMGEMFRALAGLMHLGEHTHR
jgi:myosin heavy subunit